jgi:hypothetical protein
MTIDFDADEAAVEPASGTARFLVESAPHDRIQKGMDIEFYEGRRLAAIARVESEGETGSR